MKKLNLTLFVFVLGLSSVVAQSNTVTVNKYYHLDESDHREKLRDDLPEFFEVIEQAAGRITHQTFKGAHDFTDGHIVFLDDKERKVKELKYKIERGGNLVEEVSFYDEAGNLVLYYTTLNRDIVLGFEKHKYDVDNYRSYTWKYRYGGYITKEAHPKDFMPGEREEGRIKEEKTIIWQQNNDPDW